MQPRPDNVDYKLIWTHKQGILKMTEIGTQKRHPFSYSLGAGPYRYVGFFDLGRAIAAVNNGTMDTAHAMQDSPRLEAGMGTCAHCGHGILNIFIVRRGDGKLYGVGSDCIMKVSSEGDVSDVSKMEREIRRQAKIKRENLEQAKRDSLEADYQEALKVLASKPHPNSYFASKGKTAADYYSFVSKNSKNMKAAIKAGKGE